MVHHYPLRTVSLHFSFATILTFIETELGSRTLPKMSFVCLYIWFSLDKYVFDAIRCCWRIVPYFAGLLSVLNFLDGNQDLVLSISWIKRFNLVYFVPLSWISLQLKKIYHSIIFMHISYSFINSLLNQIHSIHVGLP